MIFVGTGVFDLAEARRSRFFEGELY